jgi:hypothetical protein
MRAVVLYEYGGPEKLKFENDVPEPQISGGNGLIAAAAASVNPIDWKLRSGVGGSGRFGRDPSARRSGPSERGRDPADCPHGRPACAPCDKREKAAGCSDHGGAGQCWARQCIRRRR